MPHRLCPSDGSWNHIPSPRSHDFSGKATSALCPYGSPRDQQWRLQQVGGRLPHLACSLREYSGKDIGTCVGLRAKAGKTTHIMYIGDSRIRQHIEVLLDHMRDLDFIITTYQGQVITVEDFLGQKGSKQWFKYKHNFRVETSSSPRFILDYHWASDIQKRGNAREAEAAGKLPNYHVGAIDLLNTLKDAPEGTLPDLILLNTGAWQLMDIKGNIIDQVDSTAIEVMQVLYPLLNHLSELTTVVWALPDSFKEFMLHDFGSTGKYTQQTNAILEWVLNGQAQLLPPRVLVWDSFLPVSHAALSDCIMFLSKNLDIKKLPAYSIFKPEITWHCTERMHVGFEALFVAAQMTINHICNPFMDEKGYCCST
ncbi:uncharacterized protein LOC125030922 isoform X2 [Penaeus chinensis]|uniref:uncharacterized protein LOC125030922 isoform X2 n=1 Tax=Penaeus chinensis TaxID=139456 RepID=UPI001FB65005|nr:uncharacterized protein LOC125030922 isoform X2 [Penaeus chinensis]